MNTTSRVALTLALAAAGATVAHAQSYPTKPVRMVVGFVAGGATDVAARAVAQRLSQSLGQGVVVENRGGAAGAIAIERVVTSPPDGYSLLLMPATIAVLPVMRSNLPFDIVRDLVPISLVASGPGVLVVHPNVPVRNVKDLISLARAKPGVLNFASSGVGASTHLKGELFKSMAKVNIVHVPYKGSAELVIATASGQVDLSFPSLTAALPLMNAGRLKVLAVTSAKRASMAPDLPTIAESGLPGYDHTSWYGVFAPAGVPREIIARLNSAIAKAMNARDIREMLARDGLEPLVNTSEAFAALVRTEIAQNAKLIKASGAKKE